MIRIDQIKTMKSLIIKMSDMKPLQVGHLLDSTGNHEELVMRTASENKFEVMLVTNAGPGQCYCGKGWAKTKSVQLLSKGEHVVIELWNE